MYGTHVSYVMLVLNLHKRTFEQISCPSERRISVIETVIPRTTILVLAAIFGHLILRVVILGKVLLRVLDRKSVV